MAHHPDYGKHLLPKKALTQSSPGSFLPTEIGRPPSCGLSLLPTVGTTVFFSWSDSSSSTSFCGLIPHAYKRRNRQGYSSQRTERRCRSTGHGRNEAGCFFQSRS